MKNIKYILVGIFFGIVLTKSELVSWYRWQEMFRLEGFHLYGIMFSSVGIGILAVFLIKKFRLKDIEGRPIHFIPKQMSIIRYAIGGLLFGLGWAMAGCPGAHYSLIGHGSVSVLAVLASAVLGTYVYGLLRCRLPH